MCYGENGTVKFFDTLADNVFRQHNYSMRDNHVQNSGNSKKGECPEDHLGIKHRIKKIPVD
jgi:hypothetical protein